jgi:hypothetical protein
MASRPANRLSKLISSLHKKLPSALHQPAQTLAFNSQVPRARGRCVAACAPVQGPDVISTLLNCIRRSSMRAPAAFGSKKWATMKLS